MTSTSTLRADVELRQPAKPRRGFKVLIPRAAPQPDDAYAPCPTHKAHGACCCLCVDRAGYHRRRHSAVGGRCVFCGKGQR